MWRISKVTLSFLAVVVFFVGLSGTPEDLKKWGEWANLFAELLFPDLPRTLLMVTGLGVLVAVNAPPRYWRTIRTRAATTANSIRRARKDEGPVLNIIVGKVALYAHDRSDRLLANVDVTLRPSQPMQWLNAFMVIAGHRTIHLGSTPRILGPEDHTLRFVVPTNWLDDSRASDGRATGYVRLRAGSQDWDTKPFDIPSDGEEVVP